MAAHEYGRHWPADIIEAGKVGCEPTDELPGTVFDMELMEGGKWRDAIAFIDSDECVIPKMIKPYIRTAMGLFEWEDEREFAWGMKGIELWANGAEWVRLVNNRMKTGMHWEIDAGELCKSKRFDDTVTTVRLSVATIAANAADQLERDAEKAASLRGWRPHVMVVVTLSALLGCIAVVMGATGPDTRTMAWVLLSQVLVLVLTDVWLVTFAAWDPAKLFREFQTHMLKVAAACVVGLQLIVFSSFELIGYEKNYGLAMMPVYVVCSIVVHGVCAVFIQKVQQRARQKKASSEKARKMV